MGYYSYMRELLLPLKLYELDTGFGAEELRVLGAELDERGSTLDEIERESIVTSATDFGLENWESLFKYRPSCTEVSERRAAIAALMRIDGSSFTPTAINDTIRGSGFVAVAEESKETMTVTVSFPGLRGMPEKFREVIAQIEATIPCHLNVVFIFKNVMWSELDNMALTWSQLDARKLTWHKFEALK